MFHSTTIAPGAIDIRTESIRHLQFGKLESSLTWAPSREDDICDLDSSDGKWLAYAHHHSWIRLLGEGFATAHDDRPTLAYQPRASRNSKSIGNIVNSGVEKYDLAPCILIMEGQFSSV